MTLYTPLPMTSQIHYPPHTYYTPTFAGFPWDPLLIHDETPIERKRRKKHERRAVREVKWDRRKTYATKAWEAIKDVVRNDDKDRSRRNRPLTAPMIPRGDTWNFTSFARPTVGESPNAWSGQPIQPVQLTTPTRIAEPFQQHVQLNHYLEHHCAGHEPITYDIECGPDSITYNQDDWTSIRFAEFDQPATWPSVTQMTITAVVDDPLPHFFWPITVSNPLGITCGDVFTAIWTSFHEQVSLQEYYSWSSTRQKLASRAYYKRMGTDLYRPHLVPGTKDVMRRIDYMGGGVRFKGMTSAFADTSGGWWLFVGPS